MKTKSWNINLSISAFLKLILKYGKMLEIFKGRDGL